MSIGQDIYDLLRSETLGVAKAVGELEEVEERISSGKYTIEYIDDHLKPKRDRIKGEITAATEATFNKARKIVSAYTDEQRAALVLDPAALTDDYKLLVSGIDLTERDLCGILDRSGDNLTMQQMTYRYAKQHGVKLPSVFMGDSQADENVGFANGLLDVASRYTSRYMGRSDGMRMLNKFFDVSE